MSRHPSEKHQVPATARKGLSALLKCLDLQSQVSSIFAMNIPGLIRVWPPGVVTDVDSAIFDQLVSSLSSAISPSNIAARVTGSTG